jgi:hypothetical protein
MKLRNQQENSLDDKSKKVLATGVTASVILVSLLGGLALVVRALKNVNLNLFLELKKDDKAEKKY